MTDYKLICGDVLETLKRGQSESIQCVVTSPPYFRLRNYDVEGQIGLEETPEEYVEKLVEVFREVRRVLRDDGTLWLNLGDSYNGSGGAGGDYNAGGLKEGQPKYKGSNVANIKPKDLIGIPWMCAFALRADGWYLRSDIIWGKSNPMPESVKDRPTRSHEHIFLLSKNKKYFYDSEAIREEAAASSLARISQKNFANQTGGEKDYRNGTNPNRSARKTLENFAKNPGRSKRDVWTLASKPYREAHFAVFPEALVEPMVLAGTSEHGACAKCGAPWQRILDKGSPVQQHWKPASQEKMAAAQGQHGASSVLNTGYIYPQITVGWQPTCTCDYDQVRPCWVLDPFCGSGTTGVVALRHSRKFIGIDLKPEYIELAENRIQKEIYGQK